MQLSLCCGKCACDFKYDTKTEILKLDKFFVCGCDYQKIINIKEEKEEYFYNKKCMFPNSNHNTIKKHCINNCSLYLKHFLTQLALIRLLYLNRSMYLIRLLWSVKTFEKTPET